MRFSAIDLFKWKFVTWQKTADAQGESSSGNAGWDVRASFGHLTGSGAEIHGKRGRAQKDERNEDRRGNRDRNDDRDRDGERSGGRERDDDGRHRGRDRDDERQGYGRDKKEKQGRDDSDNADRGRGRQDDKNDNQACSEDTTDDGIGIGTGDSSADGGGETPVEEPICEADNIFFGGTDADEVIQGDCGHDELYGARGDDVILGGDGNDYLSGNWGTDILIGGEGADTFALDGDFGRDTVRDFSISDGDRIEFVLYETTQIDWTPEFLFALSIQDGADVLLELPQTDEAVVIENTNIIDLTVDNFSVVQYGRDLDLIA